MGGRTTWTRLNKQFPGHCIPYKEVADFISTCPNYIKTRLGMKEALVPLVRGLKPPSSRSALAALYAKHGQGGLSTDPHARSSNTNLEALQKSSKLYQDNLKKERASKDVLPDEPGDQVIGKLL